MAAKKPTPKRELLERARKAAQRLEAQPKPPVDDVVAVYKDGIAAAEKLKKLLKPVWFVKDKDVAGKKRARPQRERR